jgi:AraC-like DNA-binding protein
MADLEKARALLKEKLLRAMPKAGDYPTAINSFALYRRDEPEQHAYCFSRPMVSVTVQGFKRILIGSEEYRYGEGHCLVTGAEIPSMSYVTHASKEKPYVAAAIDIDRQLIAQLITELPPVQKGSKAAKGPFRGMLVSDVAPDILDAFLRLTELLDNPDQIPVLAPMIIREIHFRLLTGPIGESLRSINTVGSSTSQIAKALTWIKENYHSPLEVDHLAQQVNMAISTFHKNFKEITTLSPLQYQKRLRLHEAQRLMRVGKYDASRACLAVGYESATQFNREYKRLFGEPPLRDVSRLRA